MDETRLKELEDEIATLQLTMSRIDPDAKSKKNIATFISRSMYALRMRTKSTVMSEGDIHDVDKVSHVTLRSSQ